MSLLTYEDARPWARAIRDRVSRRDMPPWPLAPTTGRARFKNDPSLTDAQIGALVRWADGGAPRGNRADLPPPISWPGDDDWKTGTPDIVLSLPPRSIAAAGPDTWTDFIVDPAQSGDRYIRAVETKPSLAGRPAVHHVVTSFADDRTDVGSPYLSEYTLGKDAELFPPGTGRLMRDHAKLRVNVHDHPTGLAVTDRLQIGLFLYPDTIVPGHAVTALTIGLLLLDDVLDIPANSIVTHHASIELVKPARLVSFQPHMHRRGKAMSLEAVWPGGRVEPIGAVERYDFGTQMAYVYDEATSPLLPAGTVLQIAAVFDNTGGNRNNPDPTQWVGFGNRTIDEMLQCHVLLVYLSEEDYRSLVLVRSSAAGP
jgi:hypothetical protein